MKTRTLPQTLADDLRLFEERVSELLQHPLVKDAPLRAADHLAVLFHSYGGLPISDRSLVAPVEERVEGVILYDLLRTLRFFELQNERSNMKNIVARLLGEPIEDTMRRGAKKCLEYHSLTRMPDDMTMRFSDGSSISPREAFDLYLNGEIFHGVAAKRKRWQALKNSREEPILYDALLQAAVAKANAVIEFYRLLRVHGHVEPVSGDPTYASRRERHHLGPASAGDPL
jgi:hypothetical protein